MTTTDLLADLEADPFIWRHALFPGWLQDAHGQPIGDGPHHRDFWQWVWAIRRGQRSDDYVAVWNRGGAKSASAEMATVALGARQARRYAWYVSATQDSADDHVLAISALLEADTVATFYPDLARRRLGKYGSARGWRGNRLSTDQPFTVDAIGLDKAVRGRRMVEDRPDLIILDDVDDALDGPATTAHKITAITKKILPAGSADLAVIAIQNLVHPDSFFARLVDGRADYLTRRRLSGPVPAVWDLAYRQGPDLRWYITGGTPSWVGFDLDRAQAEMHQIGLTAFLSECQHQVEPPAGGMFDHLDFPALTVEPDQVPELVRAVVWVDPAVSSADGSDCQGIQADAAGTDGRVYRLYSWEGVTTPEEALEQAILTAVDLGADWVGIETDQGGDLWRAGYREAVRHLERERQIPKGAAPPCRDAKAGAGAGPKTHRASLMLADYERGTIRHVRGGSAPLERALRRFPKTKPHDLVDAAYWSWADLRSGGPVGASAHDDQVPAPKGSRSWADDPYAAPRQSRWQQ